MMDWLATQGGLLVLVMFFALFLGVAVWAYRPSGKGQMEDYGNIPLRETGDGE